jgi:hypothetical protein
MSFGESFLLLVATAILTGLLVPIVQGYIDDRKLEKQRKFDDERLRAQQRYEEELARQTKVIDAQAQLLSDLAEALWDFEKKLLKVSYYANVDRAKYEEAFREYDKESWTVLSRIQALSSEVRRLASPAIQHRLNELYLVLVGPDVDYRIMSLWHLDQVAEEGSGANVEERNASWHRFHNFVFGSLRGEIEGLLADLANELRLSGGGPARPLPEDDAPT